jgi:hypothetical protein
MLLYTGKYFNLTLLASSMIVGDAIGMMDVDVCTATCLLTMSAIAQCWLTNADVNKRPCAGNHEVEIT